jgi:DNA polymerase
LAQCAAYLKREIALVQPKIILAMGRFANQVLLAESPRLVAQPLGKLRGVLHHYQGVPVVITYPPKLLMRNSADKAKAWADLCFAAAALDSARTV